MSIRLSLELNIWNTSRVRYEGTKRGSKRIDCCSKSEPKWERVQSSESKYCVWYQNRSLGRWPVNYIWGHARGITLGIGGVQDSQVSILWNCGLWAHHAGFFYRSSDILHGHDNKACQRVPCQLCRQQRWYQGRGTKRTIFLIIATRRTNRQSSRPSVVTRMSSTKLTGPYWQNCTRGVHISRELILLRP